MEVNGFATGALQVFLDGAFGAVCAPSFDSIDAGVACRQLGFADGVAAPLAVSGEVFGPEIEQVRAVRRNLSQHTKFWPQCLSTTARCPLGVKSMCNENVNLVCYTEICADQLSSTVPVHSRPPSPQAAHPRRDTTTHISHPNSYHWPQQPPPPSTSTATKLAAGEHVNACMSPMHVGRVTFCW